MGTIDREKLCQLYYGDEFFTFFEPFTDRYYDYNIAIRDFLMFSSLYGDSIHSIPNKLRAIFSKFQIIYSNVDPYLYMCELLKDFSFLNGNCCEVGAGAYPRLAELVLPDLKQDNHRLTIYEPEIILDKLDGAKIVRGKFTKETNIADIDTIYGLFPCGATISMIDKAFEEDKNLLLAFCSCNHSTPTHQWWVGKWWAEDVCMDYREKYRNEVQILKWPKKYDIPYPIMVRQKQKVK